MGDCDVSLHDLQVVAAAHDASTADAIDGITPRWVAEPASVEEASALLALAHRHALGVAPRGGGSKLSLGNPPTRLDLILSTRRLDRIREHAAGDLVAVLEAGVPLARAQEGFCEAGQWLAIDPPEDGATIGGIIAANASGPHRPRYGSMRDLLIGLTYILPDGTVAHSGGKVVKNVAGYDLGKLFTGSLGTLGLIAQATVRLHPLPAVRRAIIVDLADAGRLGEAVQLILHSTLVPGVCDADLTEGARLTLLFEGVEPGVAAQVEEAVRLLAPLGNAEPADVPAVSQPHVEHHPDDLTIKLCVPVAALALLASYLVSLTQDQKLPWRIHGQAASGIFYLEGRVETEQAPAIIAEVRRQAASLGGWATLQRALPEVKRASGDVWGDGGDALPLMRRVKERFDPGNIMNLGRYVGGL